MIFSYDDYDFDDDDDDDEDDVYTTIPCPAGGDPATTRWPGGFRLLFARGARSTTDKSPAVLLTVCGNACTRTRGRAHANFSWAPLVGGKGGEAAGRLAGDPFNTLHPFSPSIFKISNVFSPSRRRHTARPGVYVHLLTIVRRRTSLVFSELNNYNENN